MLKTIYYLSSFPGLTVFKGSKLVMNNYYTKSYLDKGVKSAQDLVISTSSSIKKCYSVGWYSTAITPNVTSQISYYTKPATYIWSNPTNYKCMVVEPNSRSSFSNSVTQPFIWAKPETQFLPANNLLSNPLLSSHLGVSYEKAQKQVRVPNSEFVAEIIGKQGQYKVYNNLVKFFYSEILAIV